MALRRRYALAFTLTLWLAAPGAAEAACAATDVLYRERSAPLIFVGEALPGETAPGGSLLSPARFRVLRYDKGRGPSEVLVTTATSRATTPTGQPGYVTVSEGLDARAGRVYRVFGSRRDDGAVQADGCSSHATSARPAAVTARPELGRARRLRATNMNGRPFVGRLPRLVAGPNEVLSIGPVGIGSDTAVTRAGAFTAFGEAVAEGGWQLPRRLPRVTRLVFHSGSALYGFTLVRRR